MCESLHLRYERGGGFVTEAVEKNKRDAGGVPFAGCVLYLGGLVFAQLSVIPEDGSHPEVEAYGLHIRVEELTDRRVEWATVTRATPAPAEEPAQV